MAEENRADQIAKQLRRDILLGVMPPGAPIKERDNALEMGVSRTPMREAIRILAKEGLVVLRPSRSPIVAQPSLKEVTNAIEVLSALEMLSVQLACDRATDDEIAAIRKLERHMSENYDRLDDVERFEIDMSFHVAIARAAHNEMLAETHSSYLARLWRARYLSAIRRRSRDRVLNQHSAIIAGLEARDVAAAQKELNAHLEHLLLNVSEFFESEEADMETVRSG
ncbi:MAG: GntR family transcriptional regulator [Rhodobacteraceae bacterium]|nr:MAG: GntR family transcriptional regulator [Paracoccaceae bacterium]